MTVQHRKPSTPNSPPARYEMLSQKLFVNRQVKRQNGNNSSSISSNLPKSSIIYHSFHQSIQTFNSPPVPMLLSKHKVQSIRNTQQTVMRYQPFRCNCYKTIQNADTLSSSFLKQNVKKKCFNHFRYQHPRQNAVIQTCLLAPTLGGTRKLKPGHMNFSPVSGGKTRQHKQISRTNTKNPSWPENCLCCGEDHGITIPPPHDFRQ